jgi:hypothetical protein
MVQDEGTCYILPAHFILFEYGGLLGESGRK